MRRKDRALEREAALRILDQTEWMTLSMTQPDGTPYAVPVNMTRAGEWLYFHCAREGKKIDCLRACPQVCVTAVGHARVIPEQYTTEYESAVVFGTAEEVLEEIRKLAKEGYREVVLTGIHLSSYGMDFLGEAGGDYLTGGGDLRQKAMERGFLISLIEAIAGIDGIARIRLGSLEPRIITEEFAGRLAAAKKVCPHFHLSLQSGCDETLKRMNRHYTAGEYYEKVKILRRHFENPAITTDVIVGFPGETEEEFEQTRAFLEKVRFFEMHIFKYSRRKGTAADRMEGQLTDAVKTARSAELLSLEARQSVDYRASYIGKEVEILTEEKKEINGKTYWIGHTPTYVRAAFEADRNGELSPNRLCRGLVTGFLTDEIVSLNFCGK